MSTLQVPRLESLILDKICGLGYVSKAGHIDEGLEEVTVLVVHDNDPDMDATMVRGIGDGAGRSRMKCPIA